MTGNLYIKLFKVIVGVSGCFCVLFGAWLAHAGTHLPQVVQSRLITAHHYQIIHTLALLATIVWWQLMPRKALLLAAWLFVIGMLCFSGSLYLKSLFQLEAVGKLAPIGGITLAFAWLSIAFTGIKPSTAEQLGEKQ